ncbi:hypothetical protein COLO4_31367 [Corchorus olitorius]|uniref:Uncharacterized protein n=1 Tax=Corchorus olitorius TaxID=93759 RepID=A0A1R3H4Z5_9ROSI|nr:hypothetical protein COLO4_31367 [Corchorus olitorius]
MAGAAEAWEGGQSGEQITGLTKNHGEKPK